jgi:hypothetical protein
MLIAKRQSTSNRRMNVFPTMRPRLHQPKASNRYSSSTEDHAKPDHFGPPHYLFFRGSLNRNRKSSDTRSKQNGVLELALILLVGIALLVIAVLVYLRTPMAHQ